MARKSKSDINDDIVAEGKRRFDDARTFDHDERAAARDDIVFAQVEGEQWDKRFSQNKERPKFEINKIQHSINQVVGEFVRNEIGIKVRPTNSEATEDVANTYSGLIRNIFNISGFKKTQVETLKEVCNGGFGAWRVRTDFLDSESFDQDIKLEWIADAVGSVWFDPFDKDPLKRNSRYCFIIEDMPREQFKELYPNSALSSFEKNRENNRLLKSEWLTNDSVRVAEYFRKVPKKKKIVLMSDGQTYFLDEVKPVLDEWALEGLTVVRERTVEHFEIEWVKMSGVEVLEGPIKWPGTKFLPVVPVYGFHYWINGTFTFRGMVRFAKDAQRIYNYVTSAKIETAANSPKDPIFITDDQIEGYEDEYTQFNQRNTPFVRYNPDSEGQLPFRIGAPTVQSALIEQAQQADGDIQATVGRNDAALGNTPQGFGTTPSGAALANVQGQSNIGQQEIYGNISDAVQQTGNILIDIIPKVYTHEMQVRILKPDGKTEFVPVNQETIDTQTAQPVKTNDLNQGKYDLSVTLGPSFTTQRQETLQMLQELGANDPQLLAVTADLLVSTIDHPISDVLEDRIRSQMIKAGTIEPNEEEAAELAEKQANQPPDPMQAMEFEAAKLNLQNIAANVDLLESQVIASNAQTQKLLSEAENKEVDSATKLMDSVTKQVEAGMKAQTEALDAIKIQLGESVQVMTSTLPDQLNEAFQRIAPGLYADEAGNVMSVDESGQVAPVNNGSPAASSGQGYDMVFDPTTGELSNA